MSSQPPNSWSIGGMRFDAWLTQAQNSSLTITEHPVETGAAITDHSYRNPRRWSIELGMSDCIASPSVTGQAQSRSVQTTNALIALQNTRQLLTLVTKYGTFENVLIENVDTRDDFRTKHASKPIATLREVILAGSTTSRTSSDPQTTDQTNKGVMSAKEINQRTAQALLKIGLRQVVPFPFNQLIP